MRLLILLPFSFPAHAVDCDDYGRIKPDQKVIRIFKATVPLPATGKAETRCPGYVVDHIEPLCATGRTSRETCIGKQRTRRRGRTK